MSSKLDSIINLALHPTTPEGEWMAAAVAYIRIQRKMGATSLPGAESASTKMGNEIIRFGQYRGRTAAWIAKNDPCYGEWLFATAARVPPEFRQILRRALDQEYSK
ncbi:MAG: hypothetical protein D4R65_08650 [Verrucomicrobiaceae bacterium]|nr:MAG: hypothetical protein D4R65_08650 [Verrucomicrobiaceae bacterium]